jgi:hypothetical protein
MPTPRFCAVRVGSQIGFWSTAFALISPAHVSHFARARFRVQATKGRKMLSFFGGASRQKTRAEIAPLKGDNRQRSAKG